MQNSFSSLATDMQSLTRGRGRRSAEGHEVLREGLGVVVGDEDLGREVVVHCGVVPSTGAWQAVRDESARHAGVGVPDRNASNEEKPARRLSTCELRLGAAAAVFAIA
jgi:hypothetical protein